LTCEKGNRPVLNNKDMKKLLLICLLASAACLFGCNKTKSITQSNQKAIVGKWGPLTEHDKVYSTTNGNEVLDTTYTISSADTTYYYETFSSNGSMQITGVTASSKPANYTYTITADELTLYQNGDVNFPAYSSILILTSTNMMLESQFQAYPAAGSSLSTSTLYNFTADVYFGKQ
jgi:hypothetical protein